MKSKRFSPVLMLAVLSLTLTPSQGDSSGYATPLKDSSSVSTSATSVNRTDAQGAPPQFQGVPTSDSTRAVSSGVAGKEAAISGEKPVASRSKQPSQAPLPGTTTAAAKDASPQASALDGNPGTGNPLPLNPPSAPDLQAENIEPSPIEKLISSEEINVDKSQPQPSLERNLTQFGYSFFKPETPGFAPLVDIPVGPDYVIGPGDGIILSAWGSLDGSFELEVNRSGEIILPKVGAVKVWGAAYDRLPQILRAALARVFKDFEINVTMGKLKIMKVYVVGEVTYPGDYNLSSLSTVINALAAARGPLKTGSLRGIQVKRGGKVVESVDLYEFFLKGDKSRDIRLQPGDTVFVPVIGPVAGVAGNVKRPAIYELKDEKTLKELMDLAGGLLPTGYLQRVQISRVDAHERKSVSDFNLDPRESGKSQDELASSITLRNLDVVRIFPIDATLRGYVRLEGHVLRPGDYALKPGMRIRDLVQQNDLLPEYHDGVGEITRFQSPDYHQEKIFFNPARALAGEADSNLELKEFDNLRIFSRWEMEEMPMVRIGGEVQKPGEYRYYENMTVRDLLTLAGNPRLNAFLKNAEISRIKKSGESVVSYPLIINLGEALRGNPKENIPLLPFDELTVRKIPNWADETDRYVTLKGEVMFPGVYPVYRGERLSSVLERAGGFTDKAYPKGARFTRKQVQEEQQKRMDEVIARTEQELLKKQGELASVAASKEELEATRAALDGQMKSLEKLKEARAEGRMVIRLAAPDQFRSGPYDLELMGGDTLEVPKTPGSVHVMGQVYNPTTFVRMPGEDVSFYLEQAGGPTREAEEDDMYIIRADGTIQSSQNTPGFLFFGDFMSIALDSGDTLVVPQKLERIAWMREIKDIATILGQIALTAGVVIAAGL